MLKIKNDEAIGSSVLQAGKIWNFAQASARPYSVLNTGFTELSKAIALGGWPLKTTTEIGLEHNGIGELRLLLPALRNATSTLGSTSKPYVIWLAPPYLPYSRALIKEGINLSNLIVINTDNVADTLWAAEQILLANRCGALFTWTGRYNLNHKESRRLQLAAAKSNTWHVQFRHSSCLQQPSAARLRLQLTSNSRGRLLITLEKQPFGKHGQECSLSLQPHYETWQKTPIAQLPEHNRPLLIRPSKQKQRINAKANVLQGFNAFDES